VVTSSRTRSRWRWSATGWRKADAKAGFLLDGFPRNVPQGRDAEEDALRADQKLTVVLELVVDEDEVVKRLSGRRTCRRCQRVWHVIYEPPSVPGVCDELRR